MNSESIKSIKEDYDEGKGQEIHLIQDDPARLKPLLVITIPESFGWLTAVTIYEKPWH